MHHAGWSSDCNYQISLFYGIGIPSSIALTSSKSALPSSAVGTLTIAMPDSLSVCLIVP